MNEIPSLAIAVLERGFVYVGNITLTEDFLIIRNAKNVHKWGTTRGLGELASNGPLPNTKLNPSPDIFVPVRALIHLIACVPAKWQLND